MLQLEYSLLCHEESALIRKAMFIEANRARYEAHSERMHKAINMERVLKKNSSGSKSLGPINHGFCNFEFGNIHGKQHEDAAICANFVELKCAESTLWTKKNCQGQMMGIL